MAVGNFENCLPIILKFEGGKSNNPADPGGRTNKGITQRTYDAYRTQKGEAPADVYAITGAEVADCYKRDYWDVIHGDALQSGEDLVIFDFAVNSGPAHALHVWYEIEKAGGANNTPQKAIRSICDERLRFMKSLSTWTTFGPGWARRVGQVQQYGLAMAGGTLPAPAKIKIKPAHAGGAIVVAGGTVAAAAHWFGSPFVLTGAIIILAAVIATYVWEAVAKAQQMTAAKAHPAAPAQSQVAATPKTVALPISIDVLEAAMAKVASAKAALAVAVREAFDVRDALVTEGIVLQAEIAAAEAKLAAMEVEVPAKPASAPGQEQTPQAARAASFSEIAPVVHHLKADDLILSAPVIGEP